MSTGFDAAVTDRARASFVGLAIGDALGATVEFMTPAEIRTNYGVHDTITGGGWLNLVAGRVTDDTEMSLALGEALIACGSVDAKAIAQSFSDWMRSKPVDIGNTVRRGIVHYRHSGEVVVPYNEYDAGNGACMRCLPIAIATLGSGQQAVREASRVQAHITHHCDLSDYGTEHVVSLVQMALTGHTLTQLESQSRQFAEARQEFSFAGRAVLNPGGFIVETLQAVFQSLYSTTNFRDCLIEIVNRGGDADTTGAIAGMLAGACYGMESIPNEWLSRIEPGILQACENQAEVLLGLAPLVIASPAAEPRNEKRFSINA